jgi:hypothetical protein
MGGAWLYLYSPCMMYCMQARHSLRPCCQKAGAGSAGILVAEGDTGVAYSNQEGGNPCACLLIATVCLCGRCGVAGAVECRHSWKQRQHTCSHLPTYFLCSYSPNAHRFTGVVANRLYPHTQVRFTLDFGPALGGKFTAAPVATFLDPFIRDTLANLLVWPQVTQGGGGPRGEGAERGAGVCVWNEDVCTKSRGQ